MPGLRAANSCRLSVKYTPERFCAATWPASAEFDGCILAESLRTNKSLTILTDPGCLRQILE